MRRRCRSVLLLGRRGQSRDRHNRAFDLCALLALSLRGPLCFPPPRVGDSRRSASCSSCCCLSPRARHGRAKRKRRKSNVFGFIVVILLSLFHLGLFALLLDSDADRTHRLEEAVQSPHRVWTLHLISCNSTERKKEQWERKNEEDDFSSSSLSLSTKVRSALSQTFFSFDALSSLFRILSFRLPLALAMELEAPTPPGVDIKVRVERA